MKEKVQLVFVDGPPASGNGALKRRVALRIDGEDKDVISVRLDSDQAQTRTLNRWEKLTDAPRELLAEKLRTAALAAAAEAQAAQDRARKPVRGADSPLTPPHTLDVARPVFKRWLVELDPDLLDVVFGTVKAHRLAGDPTWMFIIGAPGDGKTETVRAFSEDERIYVLSSLTPGALISGYITDGPDPSLLPKLDGKILVVKDFTAVLTMRDESRTEVLGTLRDAYDGEATKAFGTGETRSYRSRFGMLACVTPVIDRYWGVSAQLGERFLRFRLSTEEREAKVTQALSNTNDEKRMREELSAAALGVLAQNPAVPSVPAETERRLVHLADFVALARSEIARDRQGVIQYLPAPEVGTRVGKALKKLLMGIAMARGVEAVDEDIYRIGLRVAMDTIPSMRALLLKVLWRNREHEKLTKDIGDEAEIPTDTAKTWLDDLRLLSIVQRGGKQNTGYTWILREAFQQTVLFAGLEASLSVWGGVPLEFAPHTNCDTRKSQPGLFDHVNPSGVQTPPPPPYAQSGEGDPQPDVPEGWEPEAWADELDSKADKCEAVNPDTAAGYRRQAAALRAPSGDGIPF